MSTANALAAHQSLVTLLQRLKVYPELTHTSPTLWCIYRSVSGGVWFWLAAGKFHMLECEREEAGKDSIFCLGLKKFPTSITYFRGYTPWKVQESQPEWMCYASIWGAVIHFMKPKYWEAVCSLIEMGREASVTSLRPRCQLNTGGAGLAHRPSVSCHPDDISNHKFNAHWSKEQICVRSCFFLEDFRLCGQVAHDRGRSVSVLVTPFTGKESAIPLRTVQRNPQPISPDYKGNLYISAHLL